MRRVPVVAESLGRFASHGVTALQPAASADRLWESPGPASLVAMTVTAGAVLGRHPAVGQQLLLVAAGQVTAVGGDGQATELGSGEAVFFEDGEQHETTAVTGAVVAILQCRRSAEP